MEKEYNKDDIDFDAIIGDFNGFLAEKNYDSCNSIIDNLADMKEFQVALALCMERCKAIMQDRMTLPSEYGEEDRCPSGSSYLHRYDKHGQCIKCEQFKSVLFAENDNPLKDVEVIY
jgi:hypothetical protein